jgi:ArsR family transcriptional regulator
MVRAGLEPAALFGMARRAELHASVCRTLANPTRLKIPALVAEGEHSVGELAAAIGASVSNISQHLAVLKAHHLVAPRRQGQTVFYRLADRRITRACAHIHAVVRDRLRAHGDLVEAADERATRR